MAQKVLVQLVDDLDDSSSEDVSTVEFGVDGVTYEIDLNTRNAERLRTLLADYVAAGRRVGGRLKRGARPTGKAVGSGEASQIREWAISNGFELSGRGRIPAHVITAYQDAQQPKPAAKPKKTVVKGTTRRRSTTK